MVKVKRFEIEDHVLTSEDAKGMIEAIVIDSEPEHIIPLLRRIAKTKGMTALAEEAGLTRAGLYRALGEDGDPKLSTLSAILDALNLELSITMKAELEEA